MYIYICMCLSKPSFIFLSISKVEYIDTYIYKYTGIYIYRCIHIYMYLYMFQSTYTYIFI